jgi:hypothetical protein
VWCADDPCIFICAPTVIVNNDPIPDIDYPAGEVVVV